MGTASELFACDTEVLNGISRSIIQIKSIHVIRHSSPQLSRLKWCGAGVVDTGPPAGGDLTPSSASTYIVHSIAHENEEPATQPKHTKNIEKHTDEFNASVHKEALLDKHRQ